MSSLLDVRADFYPPHNLSTPELSDKSILLDMDAYCVKWKSEQKEKYRKKKESDQREKMSAKNRRSHLLAAKAARIARDSGSKPDVVRAVFLCGRYQLRAVVK